MPSYRSTQLLLPALDQAHRLAQRRADILRLQHHLESRVAALVPVKSLDRLLVSGDVSPDQYLDLLDAQGWTYPAAYAQLVATHSGEGLTHVELPVPPAPDAITGTVQRRGVRPRYYRQPQPTLGQHPIDLALRGAAGE